ncbi:glucose dehydrogenase [FAD, quinone] [Bactrocera dorsalis]|uniref:Glucose dehydrogenase [FAD, quinone] n=1 Tax=Bactrocera dorsalis TaxID=27457 RepID=A0ABM3JQX6_BACDO|nr:glucose dehydrogenase [FAD, quinone] [Bactrocera dorsalis]
MLYLKEVMSTHYLFRVTMSNLLGNQCAAQSVGTFNNLVTTLIQTLLVAQCEISSLWPKDYAVHALEHGLDTYDFVVVGAGSAGSVMASRLSENPNWKVLVLEAGGDPPQESEVPNLSLALQHTNYTWNYLTEYSDNACWGFVDRRCYLPRGKMIGGTGAINNMLYVRGNRRDYDRWAKAGNEGWGWDDVLPYFERSVRKVGSDKHPQGYVTVNTFPVTDPELEQMIYAGSAELGIPRVHVFTEGSETGYSNIPGNTRNGRRTSTGKGHLAQVANRPNLQVIKNARVTKLNFDKTGKNVHSVSFVLQDKYKLKVDVSKELVLSAGAIDSPKLLMLSGVGPAKHLADLNIPLIHDLPIGDNLQDHVHILTFFKLNENKSSAWTKEDSLNSTFNYLIYRKGPLSAQGSASLTGFVNTLKNSPYPDISVHHYFYRRGNFAELQLLLNGPDFNDVFKNTLLKALETADILIVLNILSHPKSKGQIRLRSTDYKDTPKLIPNYFSEPEDMNTLLRAMRFQEQLLKTSAYRAMNATLLLPPIDECDTHEPQSDEYWRCYMKYFSSTTYHVSGTVKMAPETDETSCVNSRLLLDGCGNVRVTDASIIPQIPSANINAATIMIAEKAVDFIREDWLEEDSVEEHFWY